MIRELLRYLTGMIPLAALHFFVVTFIFITILVYGHVMNSVIDSIYYIWLHFMLFLIICSPLLPEEEATFTIINGDIDDVA